MKGGLERQQTLGYFFQHTYSRTFEMLTGKPEQTLLRGKWGPLVLQIIPGFISPTGWWLSKGQKVSDHHKSLHQNNGLTATFWPQTKLLLASKNISAWSQSLVSIEFLVTAEKKSVCTQSAKCEDSASEQTGEHRRWKRPTVNNGEKVKCLHVCMTVKSSYVYNTDQTGAALLPSLLKASAAWVRGPVPESPQLK